MRRFPIVLALLASGCLTPQPHVVPTRYAIEPAPGVPAAAAALDVSVGVRPLKAARPYRAYVVYRDTPFTLRHYEFHEWADFPADSLTRLLIDTLAATRRFQDVGNAADMAAPDWTVTGELRQFDLDQTTSPWRVRVELHLEARAQRGAELLWAGTLTAEEPLESSQLEALAPAMNRAVAQILQAAAERLSTIEPPAEDHKASRKNEGGNGVSH